MKTIDCEQYSPEWWAARRGLPTASGFSKLITPGGKPSTQARQYMYELIAETIVPEEEEGFTESEWMIRGRLLEEEARDFVSMKKGAPVETVGFVTNDEGTAGCSPDGFISQDNGLEIKCPKGSTHIGYLINNKLPDAYAPQVHGSLLITGYPKWTFVSYHPNFAPLIIEVRPNDYTKALKVALDKFIKDLALAKKQVMA